MFRFLSPEVNLKVFWTLTLGSTALFVYLTLVQAENIDKELSIGERFHQQTALTWWEAIGGIFSARPEKPPLYKNYPGARVIKLLKPTYQGLPLEVAIIKRRSLRDYAEEPITQAQLSQLLFAAQGITGKMFDQSLRAAPSAGALYPIETYLVIHRVKDLSRGIYHYAVRDHALELVKAGDFRKALVKAGLNQEMLGDAGVTFVLTAVFDRLRHKYGERAYRYAYLEAGHISQNISLQSVSLGLGSVTVGAFIDEALNAIVEVDGRQEAALYLHAVGTR